MAAPVFQADGGEIFANANNNTAVTVPLPATRPVGAVLLFIGWCRLITATITAPSGYTLLSTFTSGTASGGRIWVYGRIVDGSETAPTLVTTGATGTSGDLAGACIFCYSDVDTSGGISAIFDGTPTTTDAAGTTTCTYPALTTALTDSLVVRFLARFQDLAVTFTPTATWNEREDASSTNRTGGQFHLQDKAPGASGSQASVTVAPSSTTSTRYLAVTLALKPLVPKQTGVAQISLAAGSDPATRTAHAIKVRARVTAGPGNSTIRAALYEGGTNRSGDLESSGLTTSLADYTLAIPDASAANITDYSNLEVRLWGYNADATARTFEVDQIWLEIPAAASTPKSGTDSGTGSQTASAPTAQIPGTDAGTSVQTAIANPAIIPAADTNGATTESAVTAHVGADTNGVTTESASFTAPIAGADTNGATTENATRNAAIPASDANGATTESAAPSYLAAGTDANGRSESATVTVPVAASDTGSGSETATMLYLASGADAGAATAEDVYFVKRQGFIDTGTAAENAVVVTGTLVTGSDSGTSAETASFLYAPAGSDSGTDSENGAVSVGGVSVSGTDSGAGYDRVGAVAAVTDNFNRANSGSLGAGWTPLTTDGGLSISGNEVAATAAVHLGNYRNAESYSDDQYAEVEVTSTPLATNDFIGAMVRAKNGGRDFYTVFYGALAGDGGVGHENLYLYKRVNDGFAGAGGGFLSFGQTKVEIGTLSPGDKIRIEAIGPNIRAYVNGALILQGVDFDHLSGGAPGVFAYGFSHLDNFKGGDLSVISAPAIVSDDFNRPDGANFGGSTKWRVANVAPVVVSNRIAGIVNTTVGGAFVGLFGDTQASQITGMNVPGGAWVGVSVRDMAPTQQQYLAIAYNSGPPVVNLYKQNGYGNYTQLGSSYTIPGGTILSTDTLRVEATGSTITAKYNGVTAVSVTDTFIPGGGAPGLAIWDTASADNWQGEHSRVSIDALTAAIPATDAGSSVQTAAMVAAIPGTDTGSDSENAVVNVTLSVTGSDTGAGTDTAMYTFALTGADAGAGSETGAVLYLMVTSDAGFGSDTFKTVNALIPGADTGSDSETATYLTFVVGADSGTGTELLSALAKVSVDTGSGGEVAALIAVLVGADTNGVFNESGSTNTFKVGSDAGSDTELAAFSYSPASSDTGSGTDTWTSTGLRGSDSSTSTIENAATQLFVPGSDTGSSAQTAALVAQLADTDSGTSSQTGSFSAGQIFKTDSDTGFGTDLLTAFGKASSDAGTSVQTAAFSAVIIGLDSGSDSELGTLVRALLTAYDLGASDDQALLRAALIDFDSGSGTESFALRIGLLLDTITTGRLITSGTTGRIHRDGKGGIGTGRTGQMGRSSRGKVLA